jgi:hypothetical protein
MIDAGRIKSIEPCPTGTNLLMPPLANGHDHVRAIRPTALGGFDLPLELWLTRDFRARERVVCGQDAHRVELGSFGFIGFSRASHFLMACSPKRVLLASVLVRIALGRNIFSRRALALFIWICITLQRKTFSYPGCTRINCGPSL